MQKIIIKKKSENIDRHRNVTFSCLEAIAIIMVIDDHTGRLAENRNKKVHNQEIIC